MHRIGGQKLSETVADEPLGPVQPSRQFVVRDDAECIVVPRAERVQHTPEPDSPVGNFGFDQPPWHAVEGNRPLHAPPPSTSAASALTIRSPSHFATLTVTALPIIAYRGPSASSVPSAE